MKPITPTLIAKWRLECMKLHEPVSPLLLALSSTLTTSSAPPITFQNTFTIACNHHCCSHLDCRGHHTRHQSPSCWSAGCVLAHTDLRRGWWGDFDHRAVAIVQEMGRVGKNCQWEECLLASYIYHGGKVFGFQKPSPHILSLIRSIIVFLIVGTSRLATY